MLSPARPDNIMGRLRQPTDLPKVYPIFENTLSFKVSKPFSNDEN
jgi:hypothetical protein